jgi:hypothetical protein
VFCLCTLKTSFRVQPVVSIQDRCDVTPRSLPQWPALRGGKSLSLLSEFHRAPRLLTDAFPEGPLAYTVLAVYGRTVELLAQQTRIMNHVRQRAELCRQPLCRLAGVDPMLDLSIGTIAPSTKVRRKTVIT